MDREDGTICVADDLVSLAQLTDHSILNCLRERFRDDQIYTYAGDVLVSINPRKPLPLYSSRHVVDYQRTHGNSAQPHIYAVAESALTELLQNCTDQCCIMMGISGAGKTQCSYHFIRYLLDSAIMLPSDKHLIGKVKQQRELTIHCMSVATAFSQAATPTNSNSSRCCRYIEMFFNATMGEYVGSRMSMPLLETDCVCKLNKTTGQSNFSIFYRMLYGLPEDMLKQLFLADNPQNYAILCGYDHNGDEEAIQFRRLCIHLNSVGLSSPAHQAELFSVLASVIHLGEVCTGNAISLKHAAKLLGVGLELLEECLDQLSGVRTESCTVLAELIYHNLFSYILHRINEVLAPTENSSLSTISVLDPIGSQGACQTSLHGLLSNYTEEVIQHLYYHKMFVWEQEVYDSEGIKWTKEDFVNNEAILSLYNEPAGLWACFDEDNDDKIITMVMDLCKSRHDICYHNNEIINQFTISHSVGEVTYHVNQWAGLNRRGTSSDSIKKLLTTSHIPLVCNIAAQMVNSCDQVCGNYVKGNTQSARTQSTVDMLKEKIVSSTPYFVCCIRPSDDDTKDFMDVQVLVQLQTMSLVDITLLQSRGFPVHMTFAEFAKRYEALLFGTEHTIEGTDKETCYKIIANARLEGWHTGKTQLLLKHWHKTDLDSQLDDYENKACTIQRAFRKHSTRKRSRKDKDKGSAKSPTSTNPPGDKKEMPPAVPVKRHRPPHKSTSEPVFAGMTNSNSDSMDEDTYLEILPNSPVNSPTVMASPSSTTNPLSPLTTSSPVCSPLVTSPPATSPHVTSPSLTSPPAASSPIVNSPTPMQPILEEDEEEYLAVLSDCADHCVTRKRTMILSHRQAARVAAAIETIGNSPRPPVPQRPSWAEHSVNGVDSTKVVKPLHHVIQDELDKENWYHGNISREEAEARLKQAGVNCFLIRTSSQTDGYALSMRNDDVIKHYRIIKKQGSGRYEIFGNSRSFPAMKVLVDYHHKCAISVDGETLAIPCPKEFKGGVTVSPPPVPPRSRLASEPPPRITTTSTRYKSVSWRRNMSEGSTSLFPKESLSQSLDAGVGRSPLVARSKAAMCQSSPAIGKKKATKKDLTRAQTEYTEMLNQTFSSASQETLQGLEKEISVAERILEAASRLADLPADKQTKKERKELLKVELAKLHALKQRQEKLREQRRVQNISEIVEKKSIQNGSLHGNTSLHSPQSKSDGSIPPTAPPRPLHTLSNQ